MTMAGKHSGRNIGAIILIVIGVILLMGEIGLRLNFNWWAIFIALPGFAMLRNAYNAYREDDHLSSNELVQGGIGLFLLAMAAGFLFDLNLGWLWRFWPLALIAIGLSMIVGDRER
jgi:hypothetical protein